MKAVAESAMREVVGRSALKSILTNGRGQVQSETLGLMQRILDNYHAGVIIDAVQIQNANPPAEVVPAYQDIANAGQDAQSAINEANTYRNRVVNEAKGDAAKIVQAAQGYREQVVREAQGQASRFDQVYAQYRRAPAVTRERLYIQTMQQVLSHTRKVIIDAKGATAPIILPPDAFRPPARAPSGRGPRPRQGKPNEPAADRLDRRGVRRRALLANTFFIVDQRQQAVVVNLGEPVRVINPPGAYDPGLKVKLPWESLVVLDKRNQALEAPQEEINTVDQERLVVDAFVRYRISDPLRFYRTLRDETTAADRLEPLINSSLRQVLGSATAMDIISQKRALLMGQALADIRSRAARSRLGIEVIDLRIKRADLPAANQQAVYQRMRSSLQQQAAQIRAEGEATKREVMADADKQVTITLATATEEAFATRGEGDSQSAAIFAASFGKDPSFAAFYRSMQAYETGLGQGDTTLVLSPDSAFFKYFKKGPGARQASQRRRGTPGRNQPRATRGSLKREGGKSGTGARAAEPKHERAVIATGPPRQWDAVGRRGGSRDAGRTPVWPGHLHQTEGDTVAGEGFREFDLPFGAVGGALRDPHLVENAVLQHLAGQHGGARDLHARR